jgi:hypothetical protein
MSELATLPAYDVTTKQAHSIDEMEAELMKHPQAQCEWIHRFTPGMYIREIFIPAGTLLTSRIHCTEHPYMVTMGLCSVSLDGAPGELIDARDHTFLGITKAGTRRVIHVIEPTIWITFHPNPSNETDVEKLVAMLTQDHNGPEEHAKRLALKL